jgi:phosphoglucosamine mutase
MKEEDRPLSTMARFMTVYPQTLINVPVNEKPAIATLAPVMDTIREEEQRLGDRGRVLVRYSGTQQICRVMVEGPTKAAAEQSAQNIAIAIADAIGQ